MIIDTSVFKLNGSADLQLHSIGNQNNMVITIDNFLEEPLAFKEFLKLIPIQQSEEWFPGNQLRIHYYFPELVTFMDGITKLYDVDPGEKRFYINQYSGNQKVLRRANYPHVDPGITLAFNLYLNQEEDGESGTAFYRHKKTGFEFRPKFESKYRYKYFDINSDEDPMEQVQYEPIVDTNDFERYHLVEQKFNRLSIYEGHLFHNLFVEKDKWKDTTRDTFAMFC